MDPFSGPNGFHHALVESRTCPKTGGVGLYTRVLIRPGTTLAAFGGTVMDRGRLLTLTPEQRRYALQIDEELFLTSERPGGSDFINHSCEPNAGMNGQVVLVAMKPIEAGAEVTFDYAMTDGCDYDTFDCNCGSAICRGRVTGDDWAIPALWSRYEGYFSPYLARRIARLKAQRRDQRGPLKRRGATPIK